MSIQEEVLTIFLKPVARRGGVSFNLVGLPVFKTYKKETIKNALSRLTAKQFLTVESDHVVISKKGKQYLKRRHAQLQTFDSPFTAKAPKNLIIMFDIPENKKAEREWFRYQLKQFGYKMIQRSVWFGPSPLPREFTVYVESIGLIDAVKVFHATPTEVQTLR